jgi:hypothetical protein
MARQKGTFEFSNNLEVKIAGPLDARTMVSSYADLLTFTSDNYLIKGFIVSVYDADLTKRGIYQLIDQYNLSSPLSWKLVAGGIASTSGISGSSGSSGRSGTDGTDGMDGTSGSSGISDRYRGTSDDEINLESLGPGSIITVNTTTGLSYSPAQKVIVSNSVTDYFSGYVISYNPVTGELDISVTTSTQTSTFTGWITNLDGASGGNGAPGAAGTSGTSGSDGHTGTSGTSGTDYYSYYDSSYSGTTKIPATLGGIAKDVLVSTLQGNTFSQVFDKLLFPSSAPTVNLNPSATILFNQNLVTVSILQSYVINSTGATIRSASLKFQFGSDPSTLVTLNTDTTNSKTSTHTYSYGVNSYSTTPLNYTYTVTDTAGATNTITRSLSPNPYRAPSISLATNLVATSKLPSISPIETDTKRETGNVSSILSTPVITNPNGQYISLVRYKTQYCIDGGTWLDLPVSGSSGTFTYPLNPQGGSSLPSFTDNTLSKTSSTIQYRLVLDDTYTIYRGLPNYYYYPVIQFWYSYFYGYISANSQQTYNPTPAQIQDIINNGSNPNGTFNRVLATSANNIPDPFDATITGISIDFMCTDGYMWFAIQKSKYQVKTGWLSTTLSGNKGPIGTNNTPVIGDVFASPTALSVNDPFGYWSNEQYNIYPALKSTTLLHSLVY